MYIANTMATITIPIVLDASASATIFAEAAPTTDASYVFTMNSSSLTAAKLSSFLQYIDQDDDTTLFTYSSTAKTDVENGLHADICNQQLTYSPSPTTEQHFPNHASGAVANDTLGEMMVKYIASVLFGHPEAQAPIKNDNAIVEAVQTTSNIHGQFVAELSAGLNADAVTGENGSRNEIVLSIFEQLVAFSSQNDAGAGSAVDSNRFGDASHTDEYKGIPFQSGDVIIFLVNMSGNLGTDAQNSVGNNFSPSTVPAITTLFANNPDLNGDELVPKIWELRITLA